MLLRFVLFFLFIFGCSSDYNLSFKREVESPHQGFDLQTPVAHAGQSQTVSLDTWVLLDGTRSYDPQENYPLDYKWSLITKPLGSRTFLINDEVPLSSVHIDLEGIYIFELNVQNSIGIWNDIGNQVVIIANNTSDIKVILTWDTAVDLDIHLTNGEAPIYQRPEDCNYCNRNPDWGEPGPVNDPILDMDHTSGFGPETIFLAEPFEQTFYINVVYFGYGFCLEPYCRNVNATVDVYFGERLVRSFSKELYERKGIWTVAEIDWPSGHINEIDTMDRISIYGCF